MTMSEIKKVTFNDKHYFFGFHDLCITNNNEDKVLALGIQNISRPPYSGDTLEVGYIDINKKVFVKIKESQAFNYPQGNRQQWFSDTDKFVFNDRVNNNWGSHIVDTTLNKVIQTNNFPVHCLKEETNEAFYINYARIHRVGGYGYIGVEDSTINDDIPSDCGIYVGNLKTQKKKVLVSIKKIANCGETNAIETGYPHYVTHLSLNPSKTRIAFLHRYRLLDGGENTRLMTVNTDGTDLRCLSKGFLSHFTWLNDTELFIWGQKSAGVSNLRESKLFNSKLMSFGISILKKVARKLLTKSVNTVNKKSFLVISDEKVLKIEKVGVDMLIRDGHPMLCPTNKSWVVNDTYPDANGIRTLMLFNLSTNKRIDLGTFKMIDEKPNLHSFSLEKVQEGIDVRIKDKFPIDQYCFTRSGLHCDLHPRWSSDGKTVYFDSIHEGNRQIYAINVSEYLR